VEIRERFKRYGVITMVNVLKNFGFVQFSSVEAARMAIQEENGKVFMGKALVVNPVIKKSGGQNKGSQQAAEEAPHPPLATQTTPPRPPRPKGPGLAGARRPPGLGLVGPRPGVAGAYHQPRPRGPGPTTVRHGASVAKVFDCEIVCVNRSSHRYCENIAARLKAGGLTVDVLFPTPGIQLRKILENIINRGVKYAVLVTPDNESEANVTVNKLWGEQCEKLNVPFEEAVRFLVDDFNGNPLGGPSHSRVQAPTGSSGYGVQTHPQDVMTVVEFLIDNRPLSVMEYDKLIRYLAKQREDMLRREYGDDIPPHLVSPPVGQPVDPELKAREEDLKAKLLDILARPIRDPPKPAITPQLKSTIDSLFSGGGSDSGGPQQPQQRQEVRPATDKAGVATASKTSAPNTDALFSGY